jgi:hypothetical protein
MYCSNSKCLFDKERRYWRNPSNTQNCSIFCFLRCGEFTVKQANTFDSSVHLCVSDVFFYENCALLKLKESKTDSFRKGIFIQLHKLQVEIFCKASRRRPLQKISTCSGLELTSWVKLQVEMFCKASRRRALQKISTSSLTHDVSSLEDDNVFVFCVAFFQCSCSILSSV